MKRIISLSLVGWLTSPFVFAAAPVTISGPVPSIAPIYGAGVAHTVVYTITNNVPNQSLPITLAGISGAITRTTVANDCGSALPAGPSTCNIGIVITPTTAQIGSTISQTLEVNYQSRTPLKSTISFAAGLPYAYVANAVANTVARSTVDPLTGALSAPVDSGAGVIFDFPVDIVINNFAGSNFAYVTSLGDASITRCTINTNTGLFTNCGDSGAGAIFNSPWGIAFYTPSNGNTYAYVVNNGTQQVFQCLMSSSTGLLSACIDSGAGAVFDTTVPNFNAEYIAFNTIGGHTYAYVTEGSQGANQITQCSVNASSGSFSNCNNFTVGAGGITGIAFDIVNEQSMAYLSSWDTNQLFICTVDASNGQLSCVDSGQTNFGNQQITIATVGGVEFTYLPLSNANSVSQCQINQGTGALNNCQDSGAGATFNNPRSSVIF